MSNLEYACENFWGLGLLVWEEIENGQTVHKGLAKLLYRNIINIINSPNATISLAFSWKFFEKNQIIFGEIIFQFLGSRPAGLGGDREWTNSTYGLSQIII
jgi:hypothetical protein